MPSVQATRAAADAGLRTPAVSVIVPVHNRRELLRDCLAALAAQTFRNFEVIVVDDASTDGSGDVARGVQAGSGPVRVVRTEGVGAVAARRTGVADACAPLLAFTDSDCRPSPGWLAAAIEAFDTGADLVHGPTVPARAPGPLERTTQAGDEGLYPSCNLLVRRSAYERVGGFDVQAARRFGFRPGTQAGRLGFGEDTLLGWRVRRLGAAVFVPDAVATHHVFPPDYRDALRRAWMARAFPALTGDVPELRKTLLRHGVFLGGTGRVPLYVAVAAAVGRRRVLATAALGAWTVHRARSMGPSRGEPVLRTLGSVLTLDAVTAVALLAGSARARRLVL